MGSRKDSSKQERRKRRKPNAAKWNESGKDAWAIVLDHVGEIDPWDVEEEEETPLEIEE